MFIRRKSTQFNRKSLRSIRELPPLQKPTNSSETQIVHYPVCQLFISLLFLGLSIYFVYSVTGGQNSIQGFNNNIWWQYIIAIIPGLFGLAFMISSRSQVITFSRQQNLIHIEKKYFFCIISEDMEKQFTDLVGLSIVKRGTQKINFTSSTYYVVLSFKTCDEIQVLGCSSSLKIIQHFQQIRRIFGEDEISQKRVIIRNLIDQS